MNTPDTLSELPDAMMEKTLRIRTLNDAFRTTFIGGRIFITQGIQALGADKAQAIIRAIQTFNDFSSDNDPYGEHDFGAINHEGRKVFWKIDYYGKNLTCGSEDPRDSVQTTRVLTLMLAEEY